MFAEMFDLMKVVERKLKLTQFAKNLQLRYGRSVVPLAANDDTDADHDDSNNNNNNNNNHNDAHI